MQNIQNFNLIQKSVSILGALAALYFVFLSPPRFLKGLNGVVIDARAYCSEIGSAADCEAATVNIPQRMIYLVVILVVTLAMLLVFSEKKVNK